MLLISAGVGAVALVAVVVLSRCRLGWLPSLTVPPPRRLAHGLLLSTAYQLSIAGLLLGTVASTGYVISPLALLGAFGASQLAGAVPGPNGVSARDGALVVALAALGVPWMAATAAVTLKAALAWLPAVTLGGVSCSSPGALKEGPSQHRRDREVATFGRALRTFGPTAEARGPQG